MRLREISTPDISTPSFNTKDNYCIFVKEQNKCQV